MTQTNNINTLTKDTLVSVVGVNAFGKARLMDTSALTSSINQAAFNIFMSNWLASLPLSSAGLPVGAWYNDGGVISQVQP